MRSFTIIIGAIGCMSLWIGLIAPTILRGIGVPLAYGMWRLDRRNQHLTRSQYLWGFGVFSWGLGAFLYATTFDLLSWELLGERGYYSTPLRIIVQLMICLVIGWLVGVFGSPSRRKSEALTSQ